MIRLVLPLPPSINRVGSTHPLQAYKDKNRYRAEAWVRAIQQQLPRAEADLPQLVRVHATFYLRNRRDGVDNLPGSLKWPLDALKARQTGDVAWRRGLYEAKGYLIDDSEAHCLRGSLEQHIDRVDPRLELILEPIPPATGGAKEE